MKAREHQGHAPSEGVVVERRQSRRIDRRFRKQYPDHVEIQALEVDLHFFLVAAVRRRRCMFMDER
jgi:hypothetical protein